MSPPPGELDLTTGEPVDPDPVGTLVAAGRAHEDAAEPPAHPDAFAAGAATRPDVDDPDGFDARPAPNAPDEDESQRSPAERLAAAMAPPVDEGPDLDDFEDGEAAEHLADWTIEELDGATWAARKLAIKRTKRDKIKALYRDQKAILDKWLADETRRLEDDARFFEGRLEAFHRAAIELDPKALTIPLPNGSTLSSLKGKLAVDVDNMAELVAWAEANEKTDELLRYPEPEPDKVALGKYGSKAGDEPGEYPAVDEETGEVLPGVTITRRPRSYTAKDPTT